MIVRCISGYCRWRKETTFSVDGIGLLADMPCFQCTVAISRVISTLNKINLVLIPTIVVVWNVNKIKILKPSCVTHC